MYRVGQSASKKVRFLSSFLIVLIYSFIPVLNSQSSVFLLVGISLIVLSSSRVFFWYLVVPTLCCYAGFEGSVLFGDDFLRSPLSHGGLGSLWIPCVFIKALIFYLSSAKKGLRHTETVQAIFLMAVLIIGTIGFEISNGGLPFVNNEPIRIIIFVLLSGVLLKEVTLYNLEPHVWRGLLIATIASAMLRVGIAMNYSVKDPGVYTYIGIFICCAQIYLWSKPRQGRTLSTLIVAFWILIFVLHIKPSRTEIILVTFSIAVLLIALRSKAIPIAFAAIFAGIWSLQYLPGDTLLYFQHKLNFFLAVIDGSGEIGNSASVRMTELDNLLFGHGANIWSITFGRGMTGFINFEAFPNASVYSEDSFSEIQYRLGMFFKLHFFATEVIFYFGFIGFVFLGYAIFYMQISERVSILEFILLIYVLLNFMFRTELIVLLSSTLIAFRYQFERSYGNPPPKIRFVRK